MTPQQRHEWIMILIIILTASMTVWIIRDLARTKTRLNKTTMVPNIRVTR